jgi:hypothetical protein
LDEIWGVLEQKLPLINDQLTPAIGSVSAPENINITEVNCSLINGSFCSKTPQISSKFSPDTRTT